jgi:DNA-binding transcriptional regulator YdaS (Cro superfamily)
MRDNIDPKLPALWEPLREDLLAFCRAKRGREAALARHLGVGQTVVNAWLHGRFEPRAEVALQLQRWLADERRREAMQR